MTRAGCGHCTVHNPVGTNPIPPTTTTTTTAAAAAATTQKN